MADQRLADVKAYANALGYLVPAVNLFEHCHFLGLSTIVEYLYIHL